MDTASGHGGVVGRVDQIVGCAGARSANRGSGLLLWRAGEAGSGRRPDPSRWEAVGFGSRGLGSAPLAPIAKPCVDGCWHVHFGVSVEIAALPRDQVEST